MCHRFFESDYIYKIKQQSGWPSICPIICSVLINCCLQRGENFISAQDPSKLKGISLVPLSYLPPAPTTPLPPRNLNFAHICYWRRAEHFSPGSIPFQCVLHPYSTFPPKIWNHSHPHICYWRRAELKGGEDFISARDPSQFQYDDVPQMLHLPHVPLAKVDRNQVWCVYNSMYVIQPWVSMPKM